MDIKASLDRILHSKETLGNELIVHLEADGQRFLCRVDPHEHPPLRGDLALAPILDRSHLFDAETEVNLTAALAEKHAPLPE